MRRLLPALSLLTLLGCSAKPEFTYDARADIKVETFRTIAFDPREVAWVLEGQRPVRADGLKRLVQETLEARGYRLVEPEAAEIWVNVVTMKPEKGGAPHGSASGKGGPGGHGGGRSGGGRSGGGMRGGQDGGQDRKAPGGNEPPSGSSAPSPQWAMAHEGFDPGGELTFMVQLHTRQNAQTVWTGSVHLPAQKKGEQPDRRASMQGVVRQLLEPLPSSRTSEAH